LLENAMNHKTMHAEPYAFEFALATTALVIIDMQRDFVEPGGFGEALGNDVTRLQAVIAPCRNMLDAARQTGMMIIHTREGHGPDLADCPPSKIVRGRSAKRIGDHGPMGRILVHGEHGHEIVPELAPQKGEVVIDKPGKGAFFATNLDHILHNRGIKSLIVCGVTTEVCVHTTLREANDRGFECVVLADCVGSYFPEFQQAALAMIKAQGGIFGWVSDSSHALAALGA
jgi:nicotinamidase-related amidase